MSEVFSVRLDYSLFKTKMDEAQYEKLCEIIPSLPPEQPVEAFYYARHNANIIDLAAAGIKFEVEGHPTLDGANYAAHVLRKLAQIEKAMSDKPDYGKRNITVKLEASHDAFLSRVTEVQIQEDLCTDELQSLITEGWRIIAVCPQKGSRRPDYVLGKYPTEEIQASE